jgi:hypothetical protein
VEVTPIGQRRVIRLKKVEFDTAIPDRDFQPFGAALAMPAANH